MTGLNFHLQITSMEKVLKSLLIMLLFINAVQLNAQSSFEQENAKLDLFFHSLNDKYVDSVAFHELTEKAMRTMLEELDPHSIYMTAAQYQSASEPLDGNYKGIGIRYQIIDDTLTVLDVIPGSGAAKAKLNSGDQLIAIGKDTISGKKLRARDLSTIIKSEEASTKEVLIYSGNPKQSRSTLIERSSIAVQSVPTYFMIDKHTAYIKLDRFSSTSYSEVKSALDQLVNAKADDLIFDLRGNSGGYMTIAVKIVDEFLDHRELIVYTEGLHQPKKETFATSGGKFTKGNLVILIDENSASASEIMAGAIQDLDRGLIVGRRSYGKGLVQRTVEFKDGSAMRLTISRYYTPSGRSIQKPYDQGVALYKKDIKSRRSHGELFSKDSIPVNNELVYYTPSKRKVYGGGGIIPDVFVAEDSLMTDEFFTQVTERGLHYRFALDYANRHRNEILELYPNVDNYTSHFQINEDQFIAFKAFCDHRGIMSTNEVSKEAIAKLNEDFKILIARVLYGYDKQFRVAAETDHDIKKAIESLNNGTLEDLGLNSF